MKKSGAILLLVAVFLAPAANALSGALCGTSACTKTCCVKRPPASTTNSESEMDCHHGAPRPTSECAMRSGCNHHPEAGTVAPLPHGILVGMESHGAPRASQELFMARGHRTQPGFKVTLLKPPRD